MLRSRKLHLLAFLLVLLSVTGCVPGTTVPRGWSGGAVAGGILYIGSVDGKIIAVNTTDGRRIWEAALETTAAPSGGFGCAAPPPQAVAIYGSPAVSANLVYIGGYNGKFYAFAPGEQEPRWVYPREGTISSQIVGRALAAQDKVVFGAADGKVYALNAATGFSSTGWIFPSGGKVGQIWSTPAYLDGTIFVGSFDKNLYALDIATGEKKWAFATQGAIAATPVAYNGTVYIGSFDRNLYAVDAATGTEKWKFSGAGNWFWAKPLVKDNIIYAANLDGKVYVLDAQSGNKLREFDLGGAISASPVLAGSTLVVATESGNITAIDTAGNTKKALRNLGEKVDAPLATDGMAVFIHTGTGKLYAVNAQSGAEVWPYISLKSN